MMNLSVWPCHLFGPFSRSQGLDLNLSQSCPWCNRQRKSFLRIYISIKLGSSRGPASRVLRLLMKYLFKLTPQTLLSEFFLFKRVSTLLFIREQDFLQIHLRPTIYACRFVLKTNSPRCPSAFPQSLKDIKLGYLTGWTPFHKIKLHIYSHTVFKVSQSCFLCSKI